MGKAAAGAGAERAASLQGIAGHSHPISVKDTREGTSISMCLWDLAGGFLSGLSIWAAGVKQVKVQLEHSVPHSVTQERGHELRTFITNHPFRWERKSAAEYTDVIITFGDYKWVYKFF